LHVSELQERVVQLLNVILRLHFTLKQEVVVESAACQLQCAFHLRVIARLDAQLRVNGVDAVFVCLYATRERVARTALALPRAVGAIALFSRARLIGRDANRQRGQPCQCELPPRKGEEPLHTAPVASWRRRRSWAAS
jgi:hypothetical protein